MWLGDNIDFTVGPIHAQRALGALHAAFDAFAFKCLQSGAQRFSVKAGIGGKGEVVDLRPWLMVVVVAVPVVVIVVVMVVRMIMTVRMGMPMIM